ncbi:MAG: aldo/keto reductase [Candidatus Latescibacteria bacterium]|nr:aldo/keto reductase [Candidatus Latescibacterota bacterium]
MKRREFVKTAVLSTAAVSAGCSENSTQPTSETMTYSILGKTGMKVSKLSFGSHLSKENMADPVGRDRQIQFGIEKGINLFDIYEHTYKQFEPMSKSLANHPETLISLYMGSTEVEQYVDDALKLFGRDSIDLFRAMYEPAKLDGLIKMREKGKVRAVGIAHHWEEEFVKAINQYGDNLDYLMFPYNFVHNKATPNDKQNSYSAFMRLAKKHNYGLIGMKPFCNEMLVDFIKENGYVGGQKDRGISVPAAAIRYALSTGAIHTSLPAMNSIGEISENLQGIYQPVLTELEKEVLEEIDMLAMGNKWAYLDKKPYYKWLANWAQPGVFSV